MTVYGDLIRYRELFGNLFRRDVQAKYRGSVLGVAWTLANPVLLMGVYLLVFSVLWKTPFGSQGHYALFLLVGLAAWIFFASSVQSASR
jgi:ABC-type polysaccharide/polyol phosphate export permease